MTRLQCEALEPRENPTGPALVDPIGITATILPPADSAAVAPSPDAETAAFQKILQQTLAALGGSW